MNSNNGNNNIVVCSLFNPFMTFGVPGMTKYGLLQGLLQAVVASVYTQ